ncbi:MAG: tetratricopeptide repeat protein [Pseudomonadota bacterium]|nr:MAG: tetratricopeptide repeat protein [Pseudomonadota bacterium]
MSLWAELKRRNVFRVALFYIVSAWVVVQVAETLLPVFDVPDTAIRIIVLILALGFPLAIVFSWVFELTPEGIKRDKDARVDPETKQQTAQKLNWATLVAALLAIGLLVVDRMMPEPVARPVVQSSVPEGGAPTASDMPQSDEPDQASIAVLPFADLSPEGNQQYFSDGIAEEILNVLSRIESLNVTSRTSAFAFKSQSELSIRDIAEELQVRHVLEGSVRKAADTIRITAQLIDARTDQHLWSETYDRRLSAENVFAIQDEIAQAITDALAERLDVAIEGGGASGGTDDIDAYEAFLAGRELFINRNYENLPRAIELLERAVEADPGFARAHGWLAMAYVVSPSWGFLDRDYKDLGRRSAERALELDSDNVAALTASAFFVREHPVEDYARAIELYEHAIAIDPQFTTAHVWLAQTWRNLGFFDKADRAVERCLEVDPEYPICIYTYAEIASLQGRYGVSIERLKKIFETSHQEAYPQFLGAVAAEGDEMLLLLMLRELADMVGPGSRWMVADLKRALGDEDYDRTEALDRLEARIRSELAPGETPPDPYIATAYTLAFGAFDRVPAEEESEATGWWWFRGYPGMKDSPHRKRAMIARGLPDYWHEHGFPDVCRPIVTASGADDFECE